VHATEVGGTHPALIEALGAGNLFLVLDTPEYREVAGPDAWYFADEAELVELINRADRVHAKQLAELRELSRTRARNQFSWDAVASDYLALLQG
jgi:glycosyltransferase involved in cell wall biosynthesis